MQYNELLEACAKVNTETMTEQATIIVKDNSNQSSCNAFYRKQTCQTNPVQPSHPPIATMCYPNIFKFSTAATEYGCKHEKKVVAAYEKIKDNSNQSSCNAFYRKQTCQTNPVQPSHPPIATMCYPNIFKFSTAATEYGCKHEKKVVAAYELTMKERHLNFESRSVDCF